MKLIVPFVIASLLCACPPAASAPTPDASDAAATPVPAPVGDSAVAGDLADQVCTHLNTVGCVQPATCPATFRSKQGTFTDFKPACLLAATSKLEAALCNTIVCH